MMEGKTLRAKKKCTDHSPEKSHLSHFCRHKLLVQSHCLADRSSKGRRVVIYVDQFSCVSLALIFC